MTDLATLPPPSDFLAACPKFRILVLGNPESTKQELFAKIFGVDLEKKLVDDAFSADHQIGQELDLHGQNARLAIHACLNFGTADKANYDRVHAFLASRSAPTIKPEDRIHCVWYYVASEENRSVGELETRFFTGDLHAAAPYMPVVLVFTKYDEYVSQVKLEWSRNADEHGLSKVAVSHILRDLSSKKFEKEIGKKWDDVLNGRIPRVCVSSGEDEDSARSSEELAEATLACLRDKNVKLAFAAAQRNSALISTRFAAEAAAEEYFEVDTGHARKRHGIDMREILPNFVAKAVQLFNMRDPSDTLSTIISEGFLARILDATFDPTQKGLLAECLRRSGTESGSILLNLTPHERAVLLAQALAGVLLLLHRLADAQWTHDHRRHHHHPLTRAGVERQLEEIGRGSREKGEVLHTVEESTIFTTCTLRQGVADLLVQAVMRADAALRSGMRGHERGGSREIIVEDDSELQDIFWRSVHDHKRPDDVVLPCGLTVLPLT
ncbi:uncharacterized protein B0T15DRAFT_405023 [Chaetomium strumarium]|uniref:G domain-containing protein n=1 Tax=Chaetomium strumarium TaxID=1170767 RepID=A0AAJ0GKP9_9PEZI|nr:hypothetical protein B0T15DRAFT_405023 [Chaetomium strumarium]